MITRIEALNYRCLHRVAQDVRPFQVLVGPNASGKSTFLDVVALVRDIVRDGRQDIGSVISSRAPDYADLMWKRAHRAFEVAVEVLIPEARRAHLRPESTVCYYWLRIGEADASGELGILKEMLSVGPPAPPGRRLRTRFPEPLEPTHALPTDERQQHSKVIVQKRGKDLCSAETDPSTMLSFNLGRRRSALANLPEDDELFPVATWFRRFLSEGIEIIALDPEVIRRPSPPGVPRRLARDGSGLPWLVHELESEDHAETLREWIGHVRTALPDLRNIRTVEREEDRHRYLKLLYDDGTEVPSWLVSDGTLRLLALTLLPYLPNMTGTYLIEEPENGIHPGALEAVFQSLTSLYDGQVLIATHSPTLVNIAELDQILCFANSAQDGVDICPGPEHPMLRNWHHEVGLGTYLAGGVLE
jgi:energy-coupling factor transporter ATP-binding protein EcfA2